MSQARPTHHSLWQRLWQRRAAAPVCDDGDMGTAFGMELSLGAAPPAPLSCGAQRRQPWYRRWVSAPPAAAPRNAPAPW